MFFFLLVFPISCFTWDTDLVSSTILPAGVCLTNAVKVPWKPSSPALRFLQPPWVQHFQLYHQLPNK